MAGKSLGTLTIDLIAKTGGFTAGMDKAERSSQKWRKQVESDAKLTATALAAVATAAVAAAGAVGVAGYNLLKSTSKQVAETDRWAKSLNISTQALLSWQYAAEKAGVSGDQMADIFKDIGDKIGDAVLNKSGEAVDALNALGLSAKKLAQESPDEQLLAIGNALGKIGTNAEKTTILESLGNDLSKLLPLFDNNNEKLQQFLKAAKDFGVAPDQKSIDDLTKVNSIFEDMETQVQGVKIQIASGLAKVDLSGLQSGLDDMRDVFTDPRILQGISNLVGEAAGLAGFVGKIAAGLGSIASLTKSRVGALSGDYDATDINEVTDRRDYLESASNRSKEQNDELTFLNKRLGFLKAIKSVDVNPDAGKGLANLLESMGVSQDAGKNNELGKGETNGKTTPDAGAKKLENAYKAMEQSYQRQIALIDTTGKKSAEVTEQQKLQFDIADGKLTGLNDSQKKRLEQLASELDLMKQTRKENEENIKLAEYVSNLQNSNENAAASLDADINGADLGAKSRQRMQERLDIQREYIEQQRELEKQFQSGDIDNQELYDKKTAALKQSLDERLALQEDHYQKVDQLEGDWLAGAKNGLADWVDTSSDYYSQVSGIVGNTMDGLVDNMAAALNGSKADWSSWATSVLNDLQKVLLKTIIVNSMSSIGGGGLGGLFSSAGGGSTPSGSYDAAVASVKFAKGGVFDTPSLSDFSGDIVSSPTMFAFAKGAGLMGEVGPEAVMPLTRTGDGSLGVRMVGGEGSNASSGSPVIHQTFHVSGNGDAALKQAMQEAARQGAQDGAKQARQEMLNDFQTRGQGRRLLNV